VSVETRKSFHKELTAIRDDLVRLAALVCEAITRGTQALLDGDQRAAQTLIDADNALDRIALDVEDRCYHQLALQQPMASDLRALVTAIRLTSELERSGDLMVNVVKGAGRIIGLEIDPKTRGLVQSMSDEALRLYRYAIDAYAEADEAKAAALDLMDDTLDGVHRDFIAQVLESCRAGTLDIQAAVQLALIGRYYERIGDHAVNIGEKVRYLVSGWLPAAPPDEDTEADRAGTDGAEAVSS
jgi:phosphate transport system protein